MEELQLSRTQARRPAVKNPEQARELESLRLARKDVAAQLAGTTHEARRRPLTEALEELDRQIAAREAALDG